MRAARPSSHSSDRFRALSVQKICAFAVVCLEHTDAQVRDYGRRLVVFVYEREPHDVVRHALPRPSKATLKNPAMRGVFNELDRIDGGGYSGGLSLSLLYPLDQSGANRRLRGLSSAAVCRYCRLFGL